MKNLSAGVKVGILFILLVAGAWIVYKNLVSNPAGEESYWLKARFRDASGLPRGSKVKVAGIDVGEIISTSIEGRRAVVRLKIRSDIVVWDSAIVFKKATSLLGNYYIEVDPGLPTSVDSNGVERTHIKLKQGDEIKNVIEATSPDQLLQRLERTLPNVDEVLKAVRDLTEDLRELVNGPLRSTVTRVEQLVDSQAPKVAEIVDRAGRIADSVDRITGDLRAITSTNRPKIDSVVEKLDQTIDEVRELVALTKGQIDETGDKVREKLDRVDQILVATQQITEGLNNGDGTIGRMLKDSAIADNIEDITEDANSFLGTIFNLQTYVGLRSEYNIYAGLARHYISVELHTRPDKFYLVEVSQGPRGDYPDVTLEFDPTVDPDNWIRKSVIADRTRFTFQFAKRFNWLTLRYGLKESTGGVGADVDFRWWNRGVKIQIDAFDATFDQLPRLKATAALEIARYIYVLGGIDDILNPQDNLTIRTGNDDVPIQFEEYFFGRDVFFGAMLRFNDEDLASLLAIGGSAIGGATR